MSLYYRKSSGVYTVRKYKNGVNFHIGTYNTRENAEHAQKVYESTGQISQVGKLGNNRHITPTVKSQPYSHTYQELLKKQMSDPNSLYNKYCSTYRSTYNVRG